MRAALIALLALGCSATPIVHVAAPPAPVVVAPPASDSAGVSLALGARLDSIMSAAMADSITPGGAIAVGRHGRMVIMKGFGRVDWAADAPLVTDSTLYDLASLTKVIAATTAAMVLEEDSLLDIDRTIVSHLPEFNAPDKAAITVRMLLEHRSGIRQSVALHQNHKGLQQYVEQINLVPVANAPGARVEYTDWNMILLQAVVERVSGWSLDAFTRARVFGPLGMRDTGFLPDSLLRSRAAPTRTRGGSVYGVVHDPTGYALGGISGNAGLFSSARDVAVFAQMMLNGGTFNGARVLHPATIARWTARQQRNGSRALGWDTPADSSSAGRYMSPWSFGHTGFTGTSMWVDVHADMFVVLLTNYTRPSSNNPRMRALRWAIDEAVRSAVVDMPVRDWQRDAKEPSIRP